MGEDRGYEVITWTPRVRAPALCTDLGFWPQKIGTMEAFKSCPDPGLQQANNEGKPNSWACTDRDRVWRLQEDTQPELILLFKMSKDICIPMGWVVEQCLRSHIRHSSLSYTSVPAPTDGAQRIIVCTCLGRWAQGYSVRDKTHHKASWQ